MYMNVIYLQHIHILWSRKETVEAKYLPQIKLLLIFNIISLII